MNSGVATAPKSAKASIGHINERVKMQGTGAAIAKKAAAKSGQQDTLREKRMGLLQDVDKLKKKLRHEESIHRALKRAFMRPLGVLPRLPPYLPPYMLELLAEVAVLEEEVARLEEQLAHLKQGLHREAVYYSSSKRNEENVADLYRRLLTAPRLHGSRNGPVSNATASPLPG